MSFSMMQTLCDFSNMSKFQNFWYSVHNEKGFVFHDPSWHVLSNCNDQCTFCHKICTEIHFFWMEVFLYLNELFFCVRSFDVFPRKLWDTVKWKAFIVQCCSIENHQSPVYIVNGQFSWCPDRCLNYCWKLALLTHTFHFWELSN